MALARRHGSEDWAEALQQLEARKPAPSPELDEVSDNCKPGWPNTNNPATGTEQ